MSVAGAGQFFGWSEEASFITAPEPDAEDASVALLALADLGHCEEDGSVTWPGHYANPVSLLPPGSDAEVQSEARRACNPDPSHRVWPTSCGLTCSANTVLLPPCK